MILHMNSTLKKSIFISLVIGLFVLPLEAQKYSNEFLSIGVGARAQALGNAVVAGISDVTAGVWNPAGLANFNADQSLQLGAMHSEWFGGRKIRLHRYNPAAGK